MRPTTAREATRPATRLQRELAARGAVGRPTALDAFRLGRRTFNEGRRVDMSALAEELGINRVTLYRWVGSREQLLVEIIWSLAADTLELLDTEVSASGAERIVQLVTGFIDYSIANRGFTRWVAEEGESAMRLLTRREPDFQPRLIDAVHLRLEQESVAGRLSLPVDLGEVAFVIVRLIESYVYLDLITGEVPDARRAEPILRLLLR